VSLSLAALCYTMPTSLLFQISLYRSLLTNFDPPSSANANLYNVLQKKAALEEKLDQVCVQVAEMKEELGGEDRKEEYEREMDKLSKESEVAADGKRDLDQQLTLAKKPIKDFTNRIKANAREQKDAQKSLKVAKFNLKEARDQIEQLAGSAESDAARRTKRIIEAEEERDTLKSTTDETKKNVAVYLNQYEELEPHVEEAHTMTQAAESQMSAVNRRLQELERSAQNSIAIFGQKCVTIHQKVEEARRAGKFKGPVVGPIGNYITVAPGKEHLAALAESTLGKGMLDRFIVSCSEDSKTFRQIRDKAGVSGRDCNMFQVSAGRRYAVTSPPSDDIDTVATVLNVSNDLVFNCLVDSSQIDVTALATSKEDSEAKLLVTNGGKESMRGRIKQVFFLPDGDHWRINNGFRTMQSSNAKRGGLKQTIGKDRTAAMGEATREFDQLKQEVDALRVQEKQKKEQLQAAKKRWNLETKKVVQAQRRITALEEEIETITGEQTEANNFDIDTSELESDVTQEEQDLQKLKEGGEEITRQRKEMLPGIEALKRKLEEETERNNKIIDELVVAEKAFENHVKGEGEQKRKIKKKEEKVQKYLAEIEIADSSLGQIEADLDKNLTSARRITLSTQRKKERDAQEQAVSADGTPTRRSLGGGEPTQTQFEEDELLAAERVETKHEPGYYEAEIKKLKKQADRERERRNLTETDGAAILEKYLRAKEDLLGKLSSLDEIDGNKDQLVRDLANRRDRWKQFRKHIAVLTNSTFDEILNKKGSSGEIEFDHKNSRLNLVVQKDNTNEASQTKDVKALSGGERSFTTLSLLLALGENLETPFRVMDEFDVFLDPVARRLALQTMVRVLSVTHCRSFFSLQSFLHECPSFSL
jgi:chromosome segregation ATPase